MVVQMLAQVVEVETEAMSGDSTYSGRVSADGTCYFERETHSARVRKASNVRLQIS